MKLFKYVGDRPNPDLKSILTGLPANDELHKGKQIQTFREVFRTQVGNVIRLSSGVFRKSPYEFISPQFNAFDHLADYIEQNKYDLLGVEFDTDNIDEFVVRVSVGIPTLPMYNKRLFTILAPLPPGTKGRVNVSFYIGVSREFAGLLKHNELVEKALESFVAAEEHKDPAFDPQRVIPGVLKGLRLERRYLYKVVNQSLDDRLFFQSPEGDIYRVAIDGYSAVTP